MSRTLTIGSFIERSWLPSLLLTLAVTAWMVFVGEGIDAYYRSRVVDMVHGTAYRPYAYRVLVPGLARIGTALTPSTLRETLGVEYVFVVAIMAASLMGFAAGVRAFSRTLFNAPAVVNAVIALAAVASLPLTFGPFSRQIYDFTTLCLFTWSLVLMAQQRWTLFAVAFALACLNKESSILLTLVFAVFVAQTRTGLSRAGIAGLLIYQLAAVALIRVSVVHAFRNNPGDAVEVHLFGHNQYVLLHPAEMSKRLWLLIAVALAGAWRWNEKPVFLRQAFIVLAPALLIMGVTVGMFDEIRAYYEIYAVVVLMAAHSLCRALGLRIGPGRDPAAGGGAA